SPLSLHDALPILAAVNGHTSPADPARARRDEECDDRPDLLGAAESPEWQLPLDKIIDSGRIFLLPAMPRAPRKQNRPWRDAVDADIVARQLLRHRLRQADLGRLDSVVGHPAA